MKNTSLLRNLVVDSQSNLGEKNEFTWTPSGEVNLDSQMSSPTSEYGTEAE